MIPSHLRLLALAILGSLLNTFAAEPFLQQTNLFTAREGGYALYRIPGVVVTAQGSILAYAEARRTGSGDWEEMDILLRRSTDHGRTWEPPRSIARIPGPASKHPLSPAGKRNSAGLTYNNPVAVAGRDGTLHFLFCVEYMRCFYQRSTNDGVTFTEPVEITAAFDKFRPAYDWKVLAAGPGHGIQLKSGRLIVPVWLSTGAGGGNAHRPSVTAVIYSDDSGGVWQPGEIALPNTDLWINPNEATPMQLADGRVMLNARTESRRHRRLVAISENGASGWSAPRFDDALLDPICMGSILRLSEAPRKNRILFSNPHSLSRASGPEEPGRPRDRKNLSVKLSYDEGQTWAASKTLEAGFSAYSDLAVLPDGTILCFYERAQGEGPQRAGVLTLARFNLEWLTDQADSLERQKSLSSD